MKSKEIAKILLDINAVSLRPAEPFKYVSGTYGPVYCDNRMLMGYPEKRMQIIEAFIELIKIKELNFDVVAGAATAGIPHAAWIAEVLKKPMIYSRKIAKEHGKENLIEGVLKRDEKVILIEDLVNRGGSSVGAIRGIRQSGGIITHCLSILSYNTEKAKKRFENANCTLLSLCGFNDLLEAAIETEYISMSEKEILLKWHEDPIKWSGVFEK